MSDVTASLGFVALGNFIGAIETAKHVELDAYVLENRRVVGALEAAARRGTSVEVHLCEKPHAEFRDFSGELKSSGVRVVKDPPYGPSSRHDKFAIVDGTAYFDDRNWTTDESEIIFSEPAARASQLCTKATALSDEARLIREGRGHDILLSTETLGDGPVVDALIERSQRGDHVRVMYNASEPTKRQKEVVEKLLAAKVQIANSPSNHKLAVVGDEAWMGSANATCVRGSTGLVREWSEHFHGALALRLGAILERTWDAAHPLVHGHPRT